MTFNKQIDGYCIVTILGCILILYQKSKDKIFCFIILGNFA